VIPDFDTTALHADGFKVENDGATWEAWDLPAGDAGASPDHADALRDPVRGSPSDEVEHAESDRHRHRHRLHCRRIKDTLCLIPRFL
jgi:hypothetical protein